MRLFGHPVHVMLIHFPVALWPAHFALHVFGAKLPAEVSAVGGWWLLAAGTALGWLAMLFGLLDLLELAREPNSPRLATALTHGGINTTALIGFTILTGHEYLRYPAIHHGPIALAGEAVLLAAMFVGNYFGGALVWREKTPPI